MLHNKVSLSRNCLALDSEGLNSTKNLTNANEKLVEGMV